MSKEGVQVCRSYCSAKEDQVLEPLFIAQYLFAPVNTIVNNWLLPWMMKPYDPPPGMPFGGKLDNIH